MSYESINIVHKLKNIFHPNATLLRDGTFKPNLPFRGELQKLLGSGGL